MRGFARSNGLSLAFGGLFLLALLGQSVAGVAEYNEERLGAGLDEVSYGRYLGSSHFLVNVMENWQSEFLQFFLYIWLTIYLVQKGSAESKEVGDEGRQSDEDQRVGKHAGPDSPRLAKTDGFGHSLYAHSLCTVFGIVFLLSWAIQSVTGWVAYNEENLRDLQEALTYGEYLRSPDFWGRTMQNWQSEFLAVGTMGVFSIWLRQRGSPESKPVGAPHAETGTTV